MSFWAKSKGDEVNELLQLAMDHYKAEKADLLLKIDSNVPKFQQLKPLPDKTKYKCGTSSLGYSTSEWFQTESYYGGKKPIASSTALALRKEEILKTINSYVEDCEKVYKENEPVVQHNKLVAEKITKLMQAIGIPSTYSETYYKSTRSRTKTTETKSAGYLQDIQRNVKTSQPSVPDKKSLINDMERSYDSLLKKILEEENKAERERQEKEALHGLALLRAKYTPENALSSNYDIMEAILSKDKYLHLAYYLELNRGDWNEGYDYAANGLSGFTVEEGNSLDQDIYDCINECIESGNDGDIDGRIFRDCEYNYNRLYSFVTNTVLLADFEKVKALLGDSDY